MAVDKIITALKTKSEIANYVSGYIFRPDADGDKFIEVKSTNEVSLQDLGLGNPFSDYPHNMVANVEIKCIVRNTDNVVADLNGLCDNVISALNNEIAQFEQGISFESLGFDYSSNESHTIIGFGTFSVSVII